MILLFLAIVYAGVQTEECDFLKEFISGSQSGLFYLKPSLFCVDQKPIPCLSDLIHVNQRTTFIVKGSFKIKDSKIIYKCDESRIQKIAWSLNVQELNQQLEQFPKFIKENETKSIIQEMKNKNKESDFSLIDGKVVEIQFKDWFLYGTRGYDKKQTIEMLERFSNAYYSLSYYSENYSTKYLERFVRDVSFDLKIKKGELISQIESHIIHPEDIQTTDDDPAVQEDHLHGIQEKEAGPENEAGPEEDQAQVHHDARERDLIDFFERNKVGKVRSVRFISDKGSKRTKGIGYIEFSDVRAVERAVQLSGKMFMDLPIIVEKTNSVHRLERSYVEVQKLYVGNLPSNFNEADFQKLCLPYGDIVSIQILKDLSGQSRGGAYIKFFKNEDARCAMRGLTGHTVAGCLIKCSLVSEKSLLNASELDSNDAVGMKLDSTSRVELMQKLSRTEPVVPGLETKSSSRCLLLTNMFNPDEETEVNWAQDIEEDVRLECDKFGLVHLKLIETSLGHVYLKFREVCFAEAAMNLLHGRWFGTRQVQASYVLESAYDLKFDLL